MRRSRFTATLSPNDSNEIIRKVIRAYDVTDVRRHYTALGFVVLEVQRGDYRLEARRAEAAAHGGFRVDQAALRDACDLLGLKLPVNLRFNARQGPTRANYRFKGTFHAVMLKSYLTAEQASDSLWHELTHAMQAERAGLTTISEWNAHTRAEDAAHSYRIRPCEIEAREMSALMADLPLCVPR